MQVGGKQQPNGLLLMLFELLAFGKSWIYGRGLMARDKYFITSLNGMKYSLELEFKIVGRR